jgi:hypothetical protein
MEGDSSVIHDVTHRAPLSRRQPLSARIADPLFAHLPELTCAPRTGIAPLTGETVGMPLLTTPLDVNDFLKRSGRSRNHLVGPITCLLMWHLPSHAHHGFHRGLFVPQMAAVLRLTLPALPARRSNDGQFHAALNVRGKSDEVTDLSHLIDLARHHPSLAADADVAELGSDGDALVFQRGSNLLVGINPTLRTLAPVFALPGLCATEQLAGSDAQVTLELGAARLRLRPRSWAVFQLYPFRG